MARARTLKPEFFDDEALARVSHTARLTFAGLWTLADRRGRLEDRAMRIRARLFPYEPAIDLEPVLAELAAGQLIVRYQAEVQIDGQALALVPLIQVRSFEKHQHVHPREADSPWPPPPKPAVERHGEPGKGMASREKAWRAGKSRDEPVGSSRPSDLDQNQDQDHRPPAGRRGLWPVENQKDRSLEPAAPEGLAVVKAAPAVAVWPADMTRSPPDRPNLRVLHRLLRELLESQAYEDQADLKEDLKRACARHRLAYDAEAVRVVLDQAAAVRGKRGGGFTPVGQLAAAHRRAGGGA